MPLAPPRRFRRPANILDLKTAGLLLVGEVLISTVVFMWLEGYTLIEAFYMTIITISTVGFTEVEPLSSTGRLFTSLLILFNIGIFAYLLSAFSYYVIEGKIFEKMLTDRIKRRIDELHDHVIICGFGRYGREITANLVRHRMPFVVVDQDEQVINTLQKDDGDMLYLLGDATQDEILQAAGPSSPPCPTTTTTFLSSSRRANLTVTSSSSAGLRRPARNISSPWPAPTTSSCPSRSAASIWLPW